MRRSNYFSMASLLAGGVIALSAAGCGSSSSSQTTSSTTASDAAGGQTRMVTIRSLGSRRTQPFLLMVTLDDKGKVTPAAVGTSVAAKLFDDLDKTRLADLPNTPCSGGGYSESISVEYNGSRSPDLVCASATDTNAGILLADLQAVEQAVGLPEPITAPVME